MNQDYHYVYLLVSQQDPARHYTGHTQDLQERMARHNRGEVPSTARYAPWHLETVIRFHSEAKALAFEQYLKSGSGREFARRHL